MFLEKLENLLNNQTLSISRKQLKDLPHPHMLKNNSLAAKMIIDLLMQGKKMLIVGDYDSDGIMATTILYSFLNEAGFSHLVEYLIPSRLKDGYGLSENVIKHALMLKYDFIVTVDNGISAIKAIDLANENGLDVIITDHHTPGKILPNAKVIVNPRVEGETFPFTYISGATVAWYLVAALKIELNSKININKYLDFVAITILSDVMPLDDINLPLLHFGLNLIKKRERLIYKLLWNDWVIPTLDEITISFTLVPMINAIGRINNANIAVDMFLSEDEKEIREYVSKMKSINEERKELTRNYLLEADYHLTSNLDIKNEKVIFVRNENFHEGIIGIIAGKLAEKYSLPAYVFAFNHEKQVWKGSGRSTGNIHLYDLTSTADEFLEGFGGHKGAVGLSLKEENWNNFKNRLNYIANTIDDKVFNENNKHIIDCNISDINLHLIELLKKYGPYGNGNLKPVFRTKVKVKIEKEIKDGLHYSCTCSQNNTYITGLFFNVKKDEFLEDIQNELIIEFDPSLSYNLINRQFNVEIIISKYKVLSTEED